MLLAGHSITQTTLTERVSSEGEALNSGERDFREIAVTSFSAEQHLTGLWLIRPLLRDPPSFHHVYLPHHFTRPFLIFLCPAFTACYRSLSLFIPLHPLSPNDSLYSCKNA